jgi:hypothetical protein
MSRFRHDRLLFAVGALAVGLFALAEIGSPGGAVAQQASNPATLKPVADFDNIPDRNERAIALFREAGKVLQSPRCLNCHPAGERPTQTERMLPHQPLVVRGDAGIGAPGLFCTTCHHEANFDPAGVPGNPKWSLAPLEMAWQGKTLTQMCVQIKDPARNGGRDMAALVKHMAEDELVGWAWHPGANRIPAPGTQKQFGDLIRAWADAGASCPRP